VFIKTGCPVAGNSNVYMSSNAGGSWTLQSGSLPWEVTQNYGPAMAVVPGSPDRLLVMGGSGTGCSGGTQDYNSVWVSTNKGANWSNQGNAAWPGRGGGQAAADTHAKVVICSGYAAFGSGYHNDCWMSSDGGSSFTQQTASAPWSGRSNFGMAFANGALVLFGGDNGAYLNDAVTTRCVLRSPPALLTLSFFLSFSLSLSLSRSFFG
jgi:hypothetical protein